jgi:hypothetical protein
MKLQELWPWLQMSATLLQKKALEKNEQRLNIVNASEL